MNSNLFLRYLKTGCWEFFEPNKGRSNVGCLWDDGPSKGFQILAWDKVWSTWTFWVYIILGGGFKYFLFSPLLGEDSHFD